MPRRKHTGPRLIKYCVVCGDVAKGINFNALTCMSCKAFFRRNAFKRFEELKCAFFNTCKVDAITRKFCTKCRLDKCLKAGMKREWILSDSDKVLIKQKKMTKLLLRRQKQQQSTPAHQHEPTSAAQNLLTESQSSEDDQSWNLFENLDLGFLEQNSDFLVDKDELFFDLLDLDAESEITYADTSLLDLIEQPKPNQSSLEAELKEFLLFNQKPAPECNSSLVIKSQLRAFPHRELLQPERALLQELSQACAVLRNPYQKIIDCANDYYYLSVSSHQIFRTQYHFHRMIQMSKRLESFRALPLGDQVRMLKCNLLEMLNVQSVTMYNPDRQSWRFIDDRRKSSVMVRMDLIKPFCTYSPFERHQEAPGRFRDEWKLDQVIFDLLIAIVLFTPRPEYAQHERIQAENHRYTCLLRRYLEMKYSETAEVEECFSQLMSNLAEMRQLTLDVFDLNREETVQPPVAAEITECTMEEEEHIVNDSLSSLSDLEILTNFDIF